MSAVSECAGEKKTSETPPQRWPNTGAWAGLVGGLMGATGILLGSQFSPPGAIVAFTGAAVLIILFISRWWWFNRRKR